MMKQFGIFSKDVAFWLRSQESGVRSQESGVREYRIGEKGRI
ncbi:MAG: hypothetical protein QNJ68_24000 [Microcoleaceae cyanobacterium MO_207.B10]|nr:hypothetical protein [Microcoleaceae cyanobacterium MO_207.B10]